MYHAVNVSLLDQHTHLFLWNNIEIYCTPDVYAMSSVSFGEKPTNNIAMASPNKAAKIGKHSFSRAAETVMENIDHIIYSFADEITAKNVTREICQLLRLVGFEVKKMGSFVI